MAAHTVSTPSVAATISSSVFRVDKFVVPAASLDSFLDGLHYVHRLLKDMPGLLQQHILTQTGGAAEFNVVTFLEWSDAAAVERALGVVQKTFAADGFDPKQMTIDLGIRADQGFYQKC